MVTFTAHDFRRMIEAYADGLDARDDTPPESAAAIRALAALEDDEALWAALADLLALAEELKRGLERYDEAPESREWDA